jgi:hypothetical protein
MATITSASFRVPAVDRPGWSFGIGLLAFWRRFLATAFNPYRPELHYMRGPGPAWRAKYGEQALFRLKPGDI